MMKIKTSKVGFVEIGQVFLKLCHFKGSCEHILSETWISCFSVFQQVKRVLKSCLNYFRTNTIDLTQFGSLKLD